MANSSINQADIVFYLHAAAAFQYLHAGVKLGVFELLHSRKFVTSSKAAEAVELREDSMRCLLFGLASLRLISKEGESYSNAEAVDMLLEKGEWNLFKAMVRFQAEIVYLGQSDFVESLRTGRNIGLERIDGVGATLYQRLVQNPDLEGVFYEYMESYSQFTNRLLLDNLDLSSDKYVLDVGGGMGGNAMALARRFPNIIVTVMDLPSVLKIAEKNIYQPELKERVRFIAKDITAETFPADQDAVLFIHQLVIWSPEEILMLLQKAYQSLKPRGRVIIFSSIADDSEDGPLMAALDTAYFKAVASGKGMIYPWKDYKQLLLSAGFEHVCFIRCQSWTPHGVVIGHK